jgi:hypothetical protein
MRTSCSGRFITGLALGLAGVSGWWNGTGRGVGRGLLQAGATFFFTIDCLTRGWRLTKQIVT